MTGWLRAAGLAALVLLALTPSALAHGTLAPVAALAGTTQRFELTVPNARLDAGVVEVALTVPEGVVIDSAEAAQPLWAVSSDGNVVTWQGGPIAGGSSETFAFTARLPSEVGALEFAMRETWDDGSAPPFFPIRVDVTGAPGADDTLAVAALVVALAALAASTAALVLVLRGRRASPSRA